MKTTGIVVLAVMLTGCVGAHGPKVITSGTLGEGVFDVSMPYVMTNSTPRISLANCGRIGVDTIPFDGEHHWRTYVFWPSGMVQVLVSGTNDDNQVGCAIGSSGTNIYLKLLQDGIFGGPLYRMEKDTNGVMRLREVD